MAKFFHTYKIHPEMPRAWTMEETRIPHRPNSTSRPSRRDFQRAVVVNPAFQRQFFEPADPVDEQDMEPKLMEAPQAQGPRRVTKTENITVRRECEWDMEDSKDDNLGGKPELNRSTVLLVAVCLISIVSLVLTLLILSGSVGVGNCPCNDNSASGKTSAMKSEDNDRLQKVAENVTALDKRMEERIQQVENLIPKERSLHNEIDVLRELLKNQTARLNNLVNQISSQEEKIRNLTVRLASTHRELEIVRENADEFKSSSSGHFGNIWKAVNTTAERTDNLTNKVNDDFGHVWQSLTNLTDTLLRNISSLEFSQSMVKIDMENVWSNLNETRKSGDSLNSSFQIFQKNVVSGLTSLEQSANMTRSELSLTISNTKKELKNATDRLGQEDNALRAVLEEINSTFSIKLDNVRKLQGPIGPPGFNGSQGPIGPAGPPGVNGTEGPRGIMGPRGFNASQAAQGPTETQGFQGGGNFSQCVHKTSSKTGSQHKVVSNNPVAPVEVRLEEPSGKRIVGATCSSDFAQKYLLSTEINPANDHLWYYCKCYGHYGAGSQRIECTMHYWECPLT